MFYQLLILAIVLGLTAFYAFEGLFNALVAAICAIAAATVAFDLFEPVARALGDSPATLQLGPPIALAAMFIVMMEGLRFGATKLLPGMVHFPLLVDRIGGAVLGAIPALLIAGVLVVCLRLLPFGPSLMGYRTLVAPPNSVGQVNVEPLWLRPDAFTVGLVDTLSGRCLWNDKPFDQVHPDYLAELAGFNDFSVATKEPYTAMALEDLTLYGHDEEPLSKPVKWETRTVPARGEYRDAVDKTKRSDAPTPILAVTLRVHGLTGEEAATLAPPQAQLTCQAGAAGGLRMIVPQWVAEDLKNPTKVVPFPIDKAWMMATAPQNLTLLYSLPQDCTPLYLTVKRETPLACGARGGLEIRSAKDKWTVQPPAPPGDAAAAGIVTTWAPSAGWTKVTKTAAFDMPVVLMARPVSATSPDADVNPKLVGARVALAPDSSLAAARVAGPDALLRTWMSGGQVRKLLVPPGLQMVQLKCSPVEKVPPEDWAALLSGGVVMVDDKPAGQLAGFAVTYTNKDIRFCYNPAAGARFADYAPDRTDIISLVLLIEIPADAHAFTLVISKDLQMMVDLSR